MTPPTNRPPKDERLKPSGLETTAPWVPYVAKSIIWLISLCEIATILAPETSNASFSSLSNGSRITMTPIFIAGWFINLVGTLFRLRCYRMLGHRFTFELSIRRDHKLVTSGPYALVRHPSYTGAILACSGAVLAHLTHGSWVMECLDLHGMGIQRWWICVGGVCIAASALVPRMNKEDRMLNEHFGREWERWRSAVPYRLLPGVY